MSSDDHNLTAYSLIDRYYINFNATKSPHLSVDLSKDSIQYVIVEIFQPGSSLSDWYKSFLLMLRNDFVLDISVSV
jgi:hypothetical protein